MKVLLAIYGLVLAAVLLSVTAQSSGEEYDEALFEVGQELYQANCVVCHQAGGQGSPPTFPALAGNENVEDLNLVVNTIHEGRGAMPSFSQLSSDELAAVVTFIRNAWNNNFGGVSVADIDVIREGGDAEADASQQGEIYSVWQGWYTEEQAERGEPLYANHCAECHGRRGVGGGAPGAPAAPFLAGSRFMNNWEGRSLGVLFELTRTTMPQGNPGSLSNQQYIDIIAFILQLNRFPAGEQEMEPSVDNLHTIIIEPQP